MKAIVLPLVAAALAVPAAAQNYPVRPVRIIVPVATGGGTDFLARAVARELTERMGRPRAHPERSEEVVRAREESGYQTRELM